MKNSNRIPFQYLFLKPVFILTFLFLFQLTYGQKVANRIITIGPQLSFQNYEHYKRLVLNSPDSHLEYLQGFEFHWGYLYKISVTETKLKEGLSDGTRYSYKFNKIISKIPVADTTKFSLFLDGRRFYYTPEPGENVKNQTLVPINDSTYLYFDKVEIEVPEIYREKLKSIASGNGTASGTFKFINEKRIRLVGL